ncbi:MAG: hypothetical protein AAFY11_08255 [Cyanobacteria bacterium J06641_5]
MQILHGIDIVCWQWLGEKTQKDWQKPTILDIENRRGDRLPNLPQVTGQMDKVCRVTGTGSRLRWSVAECTA